MSSALTELDIWRRMEDLKIPGIHAADPVYWCIPERFEEVKAEMIELLRDDQFDTACKTCKDPLRLDPADVKALLKITQAWDPMETEMCFLEYVDDTMALEYGEFTLEGNTRRWAAERGGLTIMARKLSDVVELVDDVVKNNG